MIEVTIAYLVFCLQFLNCTDSGKVEEERVLSVRKCCPKNHILGKNQTHNNFLNCTDSGKVEESVLSVRKCCPKNHILGKNQTHNNILNGDTTQKKIKLLYFPFFPCYPCTYIQKKEILNMSKK